MHIRLIPLLALLMAVPRPAHAYVDPGTGTMLWQIAAAALLGSIFYLKRAATWTRGLLGGLGIRSRRAMGFVFASSFALIASPLTLVVFHSHALPRFNDFFLVGIVLTAYYFTWESATYLLMISLVVSAWVLPPYGSMKVVGFDEWYRLVSFAVLSVFLVCMISRMRARQLDRRAESRSYSMHGAAAGAD
jgi:hypothetical protein